MHLEPSEYSLATAKRIVDKFGKDALDVIEENPEALLSINGLDLRQSRKS